MVMVDQLRADLLTRYDAAFTGGFRRLLDQGAVFTNTTHDHAETETAIGHATVATGVFPRRHGVAANQWFEADGDRWNAVYAVADSTVSILADPGLSGRSPANLRASAIGDWVAAADPDARVVSISRKDRGAIPAGGRAATDVYWLALGNGVAGFTTSTFYRDSLPDWVREANALITPVLWGDTVWTSSVAPDLRDLARPDENPHEGDGKHTTFPHRAHAEVDMVNRARWGTWLTNSPATDVAVTTLATHALRALELGTRGSADLLAVSYSSTDGVGHTYGPLSQEQLDNLVRLDRQLGILMDSLDAHVGVGRWSLVLSADHGVLELPEWRVEQGLPGARLTRAEVMAADSALQGVATGDGGVAAAQALLEAGLAVATYPWSQLRSAEPPVDSFEVLYRNGLVEDRVPSFPGFEVSVRLPEGTQAYPTSRGASHGTPYHYDRWVAFLAYGPDVPAGPRPERAATVDIAPTLARLMGVPVPDGLDGQARIR